MLATQTNISHLKPSFVILGEAKMRGIHSTFRCECVRKAVFETPLPPSPRRESRRERGVGVKF